MSKQGSIEKIIQNFPVNFQVQEGMLLYELFKAFAHEIDLINDNMSYVFRSHMVDYADLERNDGTPFDLQGIGAMFDIKPEIGETTGNYRKRLKDTIKIYLSGLGTVDSIIKMTALTYQFKLDEIVRADSEDPFTTTAVLSKSENGSSKEIEIRVVDNPEIRVRSNLSIFTPALSSRYGTTGFLTLFPTLQ